MQNVDDLDRMAGVAKEDRIAVGRRAPQIGPQLGSRRPDRAGKFGKLLAFGLEPGNEFTGRVRAGAFAGDVPQDIDQIVLRGRQIE